MYQRPSRFVWLLRIAFLSAALLLLSLVLVVQGYSLIVYSLEGNSPLRPNFGNFERVRDMLKKDPAHPEFSFAVVGDTKGFGTFERIVEQLRNEPISFMVLLGDCVRDGRLDDHRHFQCELYKELAVPFPTFYVVGNHDVSQEEFPVSRFEEVYGPTNFFFDYQGCLFVVLRILNKPYSTKESIAFLEETLATHRQEYGKVFVFMHIPPPISSDFSARKFENSDKLIALFDKYRVNYVIAGDYHGYARVKVRNTVYIITGGGGAHLRKEKYGAFHHAIVLKVGPEQVSERILSSDRDEDLEDRIEYQAIVTIYPWMKDNWILVAIINVIMVGCVAWIFRHLIKFRPAVQPH